MIVKLRDLASVRPYPGNPRQNEEAVDAVARSIKEFGPRVAIVVDRKGVIVKGHTTRLAAIKLGYKKWPVHVAEDLTPAQVRAYRIADNRVGEIARWDRDMLAVEVDAIRKMGTVELDVLGWDEEELAAITGGLRPEITEPEPPKMLPKPVTRKGELWILGASRILCGDSTVAADVDRVMAGDKASLLLTDPPYGVAYQTKLSTTDAKALRRRTDGLEVANDALTEEQTKAMVVASLNNARERMRPGAAFYVCSPSGDMAVPFRLALADAKLQIREIIIWVKDVFVMGRQDYHWRHEDILYGWTEGGAHYFIDDRTQDTVWECPRPKVSEDHPTMKPVELFARAVRNSTREGELVYEPFSVSGTSLLAAEQLGRRCAAIEFEPGYVDVAVRRWQELTGKEATLETADGRTWREVAGARGVKLADVEAVAPATKKPAKKAKKKGKK